MDALHALKILDTPPEERFDRLTRLAKRMFGVQIALVSIVDTNRQWFKSCDGLNASETSREISFCGHAILDEDIFLVPDAALDDRFRDNPLVTGEPRIRFYAGCPLRMANGSKLGTLCIIDRRPREFGGEDKALLRDLARMAEQELIAVELATMDELTMLSNRRGFHALSTLALGLCRRQRKPAWLLQFDLDFFKKINDTIGHAEGDHALSSFAGALKQTFRTSDVIGRLGGDEFAVLVTDVTKAELAIALDRLDENVKQHTRSARSGYDIAYSVGAAQFDASRHDHICALVAAADAVMYQNKQQQHRTPVRRRSSRQMELAPVKAKSIYLTQTGTAAA